MTCRGVEKRLAQYAYGDLSGREACAVESHLVSCAGCRQRAREVEAVLSLASVYEESEPPSRLHDSLKEEIARRKGLPMSVLSIFRRPAPAYGAAALMALLAFASGLSTRIEVRKLERVNSLLSDSLRILGVSPAESTAEELADSSTSPGGAQTGDQPGGM